MYKPHPEFTPPKKQAKLWRYLSTVKFLSLLDRQELFFSSAELFEDHFEGSLTLPTVELDLKDEGAAAPEVSEMYKIFRKFVLVNSWHLNEHESAAMWKIYLPGVEGVAIQSSFKGLADSFKEAEQDVHIGVVNYLDYEKEKFEEQSIFSPYLHKLKSYEYEKELRAVISLFPTTEGSLPFSHKEGFSPYVPVDLNTLIERVVIAPHSPPWYKNLVESVAKKYKLDKPIEESVLAQDPIY